MRYMPMRCTPMRCTPMRDTPMRYIPSEVHAHEVRAHEMHAHEVHAHEMHIVKIHAYEVIPVNVISRALHLIGVRTFRFSIWFLGKSPYTPPYLTLRHLPLPRIEGTLNLRPKRGDTHHWPSVLGIGPLGCGENRPAVEAF
jgi:hypothetical protein